MSYFNFLKERYPVFFTELNGCGVFCWNGYRKIMLKDLSTAKHCLLVSFIAYHFCRYLVQFNCLREDRIKPCLIAALLHDIGKIDPGVLSIVNNGRRFTDAEKEKVQEHVLIGYRILLRYGFDSDIANIVLYHHESWDGSGYPKGLVGFEIPDLARVLRICDSFGAIVDPTRKSYNGERVVEQAVQDIKSKAGIWYDFELSCHFCDFMSKFSPHFKEFFNCIYDQEYTTR
ncbi:MAG: HD domain-containing protein [Patescibacteria group bacterium]|nr:HD domain-containing protein [Patescibacteria group bacterium]